MTTQARKAPEDIYSGVRVRLRHRRSLVHAIPACAFSSDTITLSLPKVHVEPSGLYGQASAPSTITLPLCSTRKPFGRKTTLTSPGGRRLLAAPLSVAGPDPAHFPARGARTRGRGRPCARWRPGGPGLRLGRARRHVHRHLDLVSVLRTSGCSCVPCAAFLCLLPRCCLEYFARSLRFAPLLIRVGHLDFAFPSVLKLA